MTANVDNIIGKFGGVSALAKALGHRHPSTVQGWKAKGIIPPRRYIEILVAAREHGVDVKPEDFVAHLRAEVAA